MLAALLAAALATAQTPPAADAAETRKLQSLFERHWEYLRQTFSEWGTFRGDHRLGDRLTDVSPAARAAEDAATKRWLDEARTIDRGKLVPTDRVSLDLFITNHERHIALMPFTGYRSLSIGSNDGLQSDLAQPLSVTPMDNRAQTEQLLARLATAPRRILATRAGGRTVLPALQTPASLLA
jgi:uncharacterized protein (DUF885 family)